MIHNLSIRYDGRPWDFGRGWGYHISGLDCRRFECFYLGPFCITWSWRP